MCHVLIIEDEALVAMVVEDTLLEAGAHSVEIAATQQEAIDAAIARRPDFITSDVRLLEGTGPLAVQEIMKVHGQLPVIFITATPIDCKPCNPPGVILQKPFQLRLLVKTFEELRPH